MARKADKLLGYGVLLKHVQPKKLMQAIVRLDIKILNPAQVAEYQKQEKTRALRKAGRRTSYGYRVRAHWREIPLRKYEAAIPEFVIHKAVQIAEQVPEARFEVQQLVVRRQYVDPFLVVRLGDERYYIEVWNEPKFENKL